MTDLPAPFIERTRRLLGDDYPRFAESLESESPTSIRLNPSKSTPTGTIGDPVLWAQHGFYLSSRPTFTFDPRLHAGAYYVQEAASMFLNRVIRQYVHEPVRYLDLCAAPGGKSTDAVASLPVGSLIVSNEVIPNRAHILAENIVKWGSPYCIVTRNEASAFGALEEYFDIIAADVPPGETRREALLSTTEKTEKRNKKNKTPRIAIPDEWRLLVANPDSYTFISDEEKIIAIPAEYTTDYKLLDRHLDLLHAGITVATLKGKDYVPHISLALSTAFDMNKVVRYEASLDTALAYLRRESLFLPTDLPRGYILVTYEGKNDISSVCLYRTYPFLPTFTRYRSGKKIQSCHKMRMPRPYICLKKSMETQEQKFTRELANSRMQIELLRNQVLLRYYAQLLELDIMQHPKEVKTLMSSINTLERYARKYTPKDSAEVTPVSNEIQPMTNGKETATNTVPHEGEKTETIEPKKIQNTAVAKPTPHTPVEPPHLPSVTNFPEGIKIKKVVHRSKTHRK